MFAFGRIITLVAFLTALLQSKVHGEKIGNEAETVEPMDSVSRAERCVDPENAILAGESTPVFVGAMKDRTIQYHRLGLGVVKEAIEFFKLGRIKARKPRRVKENIHLVEDAARVINIGKSEQNEFERRNFYSPSLLVVMDHVNPWKENRILQYKLIYEEIIYALAYWNEVDIQLRRIRNPGVRIRIAGIVIGINQGATPYELRQIDSWGYSMYYTLPRTLQYWQRMREKNQDFREGTFNVVATMTDAWVPSFTGHGASAEFTGCGSYFSEYTGHLKNITGLMVRDTRNFDNIEQAVAEMSHIMGRSETGIRASVDARSFTYSDVRAIKEGLQKASCWKDPLEIYPPGKPVERFYQTDFYGR